MGHRDLCRQRPVRHDEAVTWSDTIRRDWTVAFVIGELIGFVPPALTGASLAALGVGDAVLTAGLTLAGSLEGAALGWAQSAVLARRIPELRRDRWIGATALAAALAWLAGMGGAAAIQALGPVALVLTVPAWLVGLAGMGFLQWLVLRPHLPASRAWVPVTSAAWLVGVIIPVAALSSVPNGWPAAAHVMVAVASAVAMGITVGLLTGTTLVRLLQRGSPNAAR